MREFLGLKLKVEFLSQYQLKKLNRKERQEYLTVKKRYTRFEEALKTGMIKHVENAHEFNKFQHEQDEHYLNDTYDKVINTNYSKIKKKEKKVDKIPVVEEEEIVEVTEEGEPLAAPIFLPLASYIVNLKDGRRYLKTTIQLMLSEEMANAYLTTRIIEVKDIVLSELQDLSVEDVKQAESREALRQRLISAISQIFPSKPEWADPEPIKKVLFEEFVLQ